MSHHAGVGTMRGFARRLCPTPSMAVALLALTVALGGTSIAATQLTAHSVGTKHLKKNAVARANIKNNAVNGAKVAKDSLTGLDIREASLVGVASAGSAATAANANHAGASAALDRVTYRSAPGSVGPATVDPSDPTNFVTTVSAPVTAGCDVGQVVVGGGVTVDDPTQLATHLSFPSTPRTWVGVAGNDDETAAHSFTVYAICVPAGSVG
jgi:hypothetical protein